MSTLNSLATISSTQSPKNQISENNNEFPIDENSPVKSMPTEPPPKCPLQPKGDSNKRKLSTSAADPAEPHAKKPPNPPKKFIYGNYDRYYGYRIPKDTHDIRLDVFRDYTESLFRGADILDIGCNSGLVTLAVSRELETRSAIGIDIDASLIRQAKGKLASERRRLLANSSSSTSLESPSSYPLNVTFTQGNYVLSDPTLLDLEQSQFDTILCLSTTKWIHLNFGDAGLQLAFRRMFRQLRPGGQLVLEAQDWKSYRKRKKLSEIIFTHFSAIRMHPQQFKAYLLGSEVGFERCYTLAASGEHVAKGFRRPIQVFVKAGDRRVMGGQSIEEKPA